MKILTVAVTAVTVSLDSFMAGFGLSLNKRAGTLLPSAVALITLILCLVTSCAGMVLRRLDGEVVNLLGGLLLLALAVMSLLRRDGIRMSLTSVGLAESLTIGVAVGMDAAIANFSFAGEGLEWVTPLVFALTHYLTVALGQVLAKKVRLEHTNVVSAVMLAALAVTKLF